MKSRRPPMNSATEMAKIADETKSACAATVLSVFPEICPDFLEETAVRFQYNPDQTIDDILSLIENGKSYPKRSYFKSLKRKRDGSEDPDEEANIRRTYDHPNREKESSSQYIAMAKKVLKQDFPRATMSGILKVFASKSNQLLPAHIAIDLAVANLQKGLRENIPDGFSLKKAPTPMDPEYMENRLDSTINTTYEPNEKRALQELRAARKLQLKRINAQAQAAKELQNFEAAKANGTVVECGCCFDDFALNRMVRCQDPENAHFFCVNCARQTAENAVGQSKYELVCMSMDQCKAGFSRNERRKFLTDHLSAALDRIENEAVLRMAGIENLERCPFCPYAAEYPLVETNREFRCDNPDCQKVSCRLCKEETHIPKTCEEVARENGIGARHEIEEAMSAALIRKCNKCGTPFIKEMGCNKMTCTAANCRNIQCYVCSKSCDYSHFNDVNRGGKQGNCPLFDNVDARHNAEVQAAEEKARKKVLESNRRVDKDLLKFDMAGSKPGEPSNPAVNQIPAGRHPRRQLSPRLIQAPVMQAAQPWVAAQPVVGQNIVGQQVLQGNVGGPQAHLYHVPPERPRDDVQIQPALPRPYSVPGQIGNQNGLPARPPTEDPYHAYGGFEPPPGMADVLRFPAAQYQAQPQQPRQFRHIPDALNRQPDEPNFDWLANLPFDNRSNLNQPQPLGPEAPAGPGYGARLEPAPAPRELKRMKHRKKSARRPPNSLATQQASQQSRHIQELRQARKQVWQMNEQYVPQPEAQSPSAGALNLNDQDAQRPHNPAAKQQAQQDPQAREQAHLAHERQQVQKQAQRDWEPQQGQYRHPNVDAPGGHGLYAQWRRDRTVSKRNEARRVIRAGSGDGEHGTVDVQELAIQDMAPVERAPPQVNDFNPNLLRQPPAPDHPNWLMPAGQQERAPQELLAPVAALRQRLALPQGAAAAGRTRNKPLELE
ncbi:ring finger protein [Colletotrichum incanum]|uniref:Ring finger protein n=1 Tax=Colletotrichum incanum TaxID=1573173 RepID=A0A161VQF3_COLIC|nr:ring finger protein [Colletotrichum incanum]